jgi:hypothetical protein
MRSQNASRREDLIENGVQHEVVRSRELSVSEQTQDDALDTDLDHDLVVWLREHHETYLDSDKSGHVPLKEVRLQEALESAYERSEELLHSAIASPLTDSGVYVGTVVWQGQEVLLQRISPTNTIIHSKVLLSEIPRTGEFVRIAYRDGSASVRELAPPTTSRELGR